MVIIGLLALAAATDIASVNLGTPTVEYSSTLPARKIEACLRHMSELGRPKVARMDGMVLLAWGDFNKNPSAVRRAALSQGTEWTRIRVWADMGLMTQVSRCAPIPVVTAVPTR